MATLNKEQVEQRENDFYDEKCPPSEWLQQQNTENKSTKDKTIILPSSVKKDDKIKIYFSKEITASPKIISKYSEISEISCNSELSILNSNSKSNLEDDKSTQRTQKKDRGIDLDSTKYDSFYFNFFENSEKSEPEPFFNEHLLLDNKRVRTDDHDENFLSINYDFSI